MILKKLWVFCFLIGVITLSLISCTSSEINVLSYQQYPLRLTAHYINSEMGTSAEVDIELTAPYNGKIVYTKPDTLAGYTVCVKDGEISVIIEGMEIPFPGDSISDAEVIVNMFSLDKNRLDSTPQPDTAVFNSSVGRVTLKFSPDFTLPVCMQAANVTLQPKQ